VLHNNDITNTGNKIIISDTDLHSGLWISVLLLEDTEFTTLTDQKLISGTWDGRSFVKGTFLTGSFTDVKLVSGEVCVYA